MIAREAGAFVNDLFSIGVEFTDEEDRTNGGEKLRVVKTKGAGGALMRKLAEAVQKDPNVTVRTKTSLVDVPTFVLIDRLCLHSCLRDMRFRRLLNYRFL